MKLSILPALLLATAFSSSAKESNGQKLLDKTLSLEYKDQELGQVLTAIEGATTARFIYSPELIEPSRHVSIHVRNEKLSRVLDSLLYPLSIRYQIVNNYIVLKGKEDDPTSPAGEITIMDDSLLLSQIVRGKVSSASGQPIEGVNVLIKNTSTGTFTNAAGEFRISVADGSAILVFSHVGYESLEITVGDKKTLNIQLTALSNQLNDVVVVGYGTQKKVNLTGSVASISAAELNKRPVTNVANLLQGKVTGLQVVQASGEPV